MHLGIVLIAAIPAYLAGGIAIFAGLGWLLAVATFAATSALVLMGLIGLLIWREVRGDSGVRTKLAR